MQYFIRRRVLTVSVEKVGQPGIMETDVTGILQ